MSPISPPFGLLKPTRRLYLLASAAAVLSPAHLLARQGEALSQPLRLGCDEALIESGLAQALQKAFAHQTGLLISLHSEPASYIFGKLKTAEIDMCLTLDPNNELMVSQIGWARDRTRLGFGSFMIVGSKRLHAKLELKTPVPHFELMPLLAAEKTPFLSRGDYSGTYHFEQTLWAPLQVSFSPSWYQIANQDSPIWLQAKQLEACTLIERGVWLRIANKSGLTVWSDNHKGWSVPIHLMRSTQSNHPAARLFLQWVTQKLGQRITGQHPGYQNNSAQGNLS